MNDFFKSLIPLCPRVHLSIVWEVDEHDESGDFVLHDVAVHATTIVNGEMLVGHSEFLEGIPIADGENPEDEDLILSGHLEELCQEALSKLKEGLAPGMPIEREISSAMEKIESSGGQSSP